MHHLLASGACLLLATLLALTPATNVRAQGVDDASVAAEGVDWKPFEEAVALAASENKKLIIDVYAPWCPWCRRLQREVYTDPSVQRYLSEHFVATRIDGDDTESTITFKSYTLTQNEMASALQATGFPTTVFLAANSEYITRLPGFVDAPEFLQVLQFIGTEAYTTLTYDQFVQQRQQD